MRRRLFNFATALSLLLFLATATLWVRSYFGLVGYQTSAHGDAFFLEVVRGGFQYGHFGKESFGKGIYGDILPLTGWYSGPAKDALIVHTRFGFGSASLLSPKISMTLIPAFFPLVVFAVMPMIWFYSWRRHHQDAGKPRCPVCRYDLTGNAFGTCPECGSKIATN